MDFEKREVGQQDKSPENSQERKEFAEMVSEMIQINKGIEEDLENLKKIAMQSDPISESHREIAKTLKTRLENTRGKITGLGLIIEATPPRE